MRLKLERAGAARIKRSNGMAAYLYEGKSGKRYAAGFAPGAIKPSFLYSFESESLRSAWASKWVN